MLVKKCLVCGIEFSMPYNYSYKQFSEKKYCSYKCSGIGQVESRTGRKIKNREGRIWVSSMKGKHQSEQAKRKLSLARTGLPGWSKGLTKETSDGIRKISESKLGPKHWNWKNGKAKTEMGYILVLSPEHPFAINKGYVREHRLIAEKYLGRYLTKREVIHHINGIKDDNRPENLYLFPNNFKHRKYHDSPYSLTSNII